MPRVTNRWPLEGHTSWYHFTERLGDEAEDSTVEYDLSLPAGFDRVDVAAARVLRHGGPNEADMAFRAVLYTHLGAITVAGGHADAAMKRAVLIFKGATDAEFAAVERMNWTDLDLELHKIAGQRTARVKGLSALLTWAQENRVKARRDNAIHGYWWDYADCGVRRGRFRRDGSSSTIIGTIEDLAEDYDLIMKFASSLDDAIERSWPQVRLGSHADASAPADPPLAAHKNPGR